MKKRSFIYLIIIAVFSIIGGCKNTVDNSVTIKNLAAGDIIVNFRGQAVSVASGTTGEVQEIPEGTYDYSTTYTIPAGATSAAEGSGINGQVKIKAGTKVLLIYSSTLVSGVYTISATVSNSDDQSTGTTSP